VTPEQLAPKLRKAFDKRVLMERIVRQGQRIAMHESPRKRGTLRRSHATRVEQGGNRGVIGTNLGYARAVHEGSRPHIIRPVRKKALAWKGGRHPVKSVRHPGYRGNPWLKRTAAKLAPIAQREFGDSVVIK
jgi:hypothetical protein